MWLWMTSGPMSREVRGERADGDRVVRLVDDRHRDAAPLELADRAAAARATRRDDVVAASGRSRSPASRGAPGRRRSCPVARISTTRTRAGPGSVRSVDRRRSRDRRRRGRVISRSVRGRGSAGSARRPRPTRTCRARCRAGSRAGGGRWRCARSTYRATMTTPGDRSRASGSTPGVVVARSVRRRRSGCRRRSAGRRRSGSVSSQRSVGPKCSNRRRKNRRLQSPPGVGGNSPSRAPALLVEVDEVSRSASGSAESVEAALAGRLGPAHLAPDLVAVLLVERRQVRRRSPRPPGASRPGRRPRARASTVQRTTPAAAERRGQRVRGGVAAAEAAQVHDVPRPASVRGAGTIRRGTPTTASATPGRSAGAASTVA